MGIRSDNFETGVSGWAISSDGDAEFDDVTLRGDLLAAGEIQIAGNILADSAAVSTWTPTLAQGASTDIDKDVRRANYWRIGPLAVFDIWIAASANGTAGSPVTISLPFAVTSAGGQLWVNDDSDSAKTYLGAAYTFTSTTLLSLANERSAYGWGQAPNIALASDDQVGGIVWAIPA